MEKLFEFWKKYKILIIIFFIIGIIILITYRKDKHKMVYVFPHTLKVENNTNYDISRDMKIIAQEIFKYDSLNIKIFYMYVENFDPSINIKAFIIPNVVGGYTIFLKENLNLNEVKTIICHEMTHIYQYEENMLEMVGLHKYLYKGKYIDISKVHYWDRPFEKDARVATDTIKRKLNKLR